MTRLQTRPERGRTARSVALGLAVLSGMAVAAGGLRPSAAQQPTLNGTAIYRERMALPENAAFEATVRDVTRPDRASELIGRTRIEPIQQLPIRFGIPYDPNLVKPGHRYTIQARIVADGRLLFATVDPVPVFEGGRAMPVDLVLPRSSGIAVEELPPPTAQSLPGRSAPPTAPLGPPTILGPYGDAPAAPPAAPAYDIPTPAAPAPGAPPPIAPPAAQAEAAPQGGSRAGSPADTSYGPLVPLPATFAGTMPCADCEGIRHTLALSPDRAFTLQLEYLGRPGDPGYVYRGQWVLDEQSRVLTLSGDSQRPLAFVIKDPNTLRMLDAAGREIVSNLNYDLTRTRTLDRTATRPSAPAGRAGAGVYPAPQGSQPAPLPPPTAVSAPGYLLRGFYRSNGDESQFVECGGGRPVPVAPEQGESPELQRAYDRSRRRPGEDMLIEVEGRIAIGPRPDGNSLGRVLVVDRFVGLRPGESCTPAEVRASAQTPDTPAPSDQTAAVPEPAPARTPAEPDAPLRGTYWKLTRIGSQAVTTPPGLGEPHLVLNPDIRQFSGHSGCNDLGGQFFIDKHYLTFSLGSRTPQACESGVEQERTYRTELEKTEGWSVAGNRLTLYDSAGTATLRFRASYDE